METNFNAAVVRVIDIEGGYSNYSWDPGGETKYGISQAAFPQIDIKNLTFTNACALYKEHYWDKANCDMLPWIIAFPVFAAAVIHDPKDAVVFLQKALHVNPDGVNGPITARAVAATVDKRRLLTEYLSHEAVYMAGRKAWPNAGRGWMRRLFLVQQEALLKGA